MLVVWNRSRQGRGLMRITTLIVMVVLCVGALFAGLHLGLAATGASASSRTWPSRLAPPGIAASPQLMASATALTAHPPAGLAFEENRGQLDRSVEFLVRSHGFYVALTPSGALFFPGGRQPGRLLLQFAGSAAVHGIGEGRLPATVTYMKGRDASRWLTGIPTFSRIRYPAVYPGVDLVYHTDGAELEYDFEVAAAADPGQIRVTVGGARSLKVGRDGALDVESRAWTLRMKQPTAFQTSAGGRRSPVAARFTVQHGQVKLAVGAYDRTRSLVIDPVFSYSTFLGGPSNDYVRAIAVDGAGNAYVTGETWSNGFPTTPGAYKTSCGKGGDCVYDFTFGLFDSDAFVTKLGPDGSVVWSTFLGGDTVCCGGIPVDNKNYDRGTSIAVDGGGQVVVVGTTDAVDFPTTPNAIAPSYMGGLSKAFITKLNAAGTSLVYSTFFGGNVGGSINVSEANGVALDSSGDSYVVGYTTSTDMLVTPGVIQPICGQVSGVPCANAFAAKLSPSGSLLASTYLGPGDGSACCAGSRGNSIAVDALGNAYLTGITTQQLGSTTVRPFPTTPGAYDRTFTGQMKLFVSKLNPGFTQLVYSTLLGGTGEDSADWGAIAVDSNGYAVITGYTSSTDFPIVNAFQPAYGGPGIYGGGHYDAFVTRLNPTGSALAYSTYLGGRWDDYGYAVSVDQAGDAYVTGATMSPNFPVANAIPTELPGNRCGTDECLLAFLTEIAPSGSLVYSDELGGTNGQEGLALAIDSAGALYLGGDTFSPDFPTQLPGQPAYAGGDCSAATTSIIVSIVVYRCGDGFVTKLSPGNGVPPRIAGGKYNAIPPSRILDTRPGTQVGPYGHPVGAAGSIDVQVAGFPGSGVPSNAAGAVLNVTVTDTTAPSYLTVYPKGASRPTASNLNWPAGRTVPNLVEVALGQGGMVTLFNFQGSTDVVIDVEGYVSPPDQSATLDGLFHPVVPVRLLDTRPASQVGPYSTPVGPGGVISLNVCPWPPVPSDASVVLNVTVTDTTAASYLTMWPAGAARPTASNLNWVAGQTVPNRVMVKPGAGCVVDIYNLAGVTDVVVDLNGWYNGPNGDDGTRFTGTVPFRILDTRPGTQVGPYGQPVGQNSTLPVQVTGVVPAGASAVVLNVTVTDTAAASYLTVWPAGGTRPTASDLNWVQGLTVPNLTVVGIGQGGQINAYNFAGSVDLVIDVVGYFS
jgi:hypothetical protein